MKKNPSDEMIKIHKFLGIEEIVLPSKEIRWGKATSLYDISQDTSSYIIFNAHSKKKIDPKVRKQFLKLYAKSNESLFNFLGY